MHWIEFREVYDRINKATGKAEKVVEGIVKYLNAKHQLVYGNDEYVDRFIIVARYLGLQDKIRNRIASRQQKAAYEAAQAAKGPAPREEWVLRLLQLALLWRQWDLLHCLVWMI